MIHNLLLIVLGVFLVLPFFVKSLAPEHPNKAVSLQRRALLIATAAASSSTTLVPILVAQAALEEEAFDCLSDLPPIEPDCLRVFLCRHGETENNRLKIVQGARVNVSLNEKGREQARRLGEALQRATSPPSLCLHSPLLRAKETAMIAASTFSRPRPRLNMSPSLTEVDFGETVEGKPVSLERVKMVSTYAAWAVGDLEAQMAGEGETGRHVFDRTQEALAALVEQGSKHVSIAAVTHSSFLRILLATFSNSGLLQTSAIELKNAAVTVIDIQRTGQAIITSKSPVLGGSALSKAPLDYSLVVPQGKIIRINEKRHLNGL
jgi:broad specificity phosphatase PhoE